MDRNTSIITIFGILVFGIVGLAFALTPQQIFVSTSYYATNQFPKLDPPQCQGCHIELREIIYYVGMPFAIELNDLEVNRSYLLVTPMDVYFLQPRIQNDSVVLYSNSDKEKGEILLFRLINSNPEYLHLSHYFNFNDLLLLEEYHLTFNIPNG